MDIAARAKRSASGRFLPVVSARVGSGAASRPGGTAVARHLVLGYRPGWQSLDDLNAIARHVADIDPTIATFIVPTTHHNGVTRKRAAKRPTLVVSNGRIPVFRPLRGKVYQGWAIPKIEELRRLAAAGVPVPRTAILTPGLKLDPAEWGAFVIVKPTDIASSSHGYGIQLMRTPRVRYIAPSDYPHDHPGRLGPMMVQQYIDTGPKLALYRALTLFGEPLYVQFNCARGPRVDLSASDDEIEKAAIAHQAVDEQDRYLVKEADVIALARAAHEALPEIPLKGCDLLREDGTGKLYVIELNCGGNTWHFSSRHLEKLRAELGPAYESERYRQFDAMRTAARVLVERTNAEAV
jgi:hypothetical protein